MVTTFSRPFNIFKAAEHKKQMPATADLTRLDSVEGTALNAAIAEASDLISVSIGTDVEGTVSALASMVEPTNLFFDKVMVMTDEPEVRAARLSLVSLLRDQVLRVADITQLVFEGEST